MPDLVTRTEVCNFMRWQESNASVQMDVDLYIPIASDLVEQYCQTTFHDEVGVTKYVDGSGDGRLWLPKFLRTLTSVESLDDYGTAYDVYTDVNGWPRNPRKGLFTGLTRLSTGGFPPGSANIGVTGDWGLETTPGTIKVATSLTLKHLLDYSLINDFISKESAGGRYV